MVKAFRGYVKKLRTKRFLPKYMELVKKTKDNTLVFKEISRSELCRKLSKLPKGKCIRIWRSWFDPDTGVFTEPKEFKVGLTYPEKGNKPLVLFKVYAVDSIYKTNGVKRAPKWIVRGTCAISSVMQGRDCIGCEGERYTQKKHLEVSNQLLLATSNIENNLITNIIIVKKK